MANQQYLSPLQEVHKKIQEAHEVPAKNEKGTTRSAGKGLKTKPNARTSPVPEKKPFHIWSPMVTCNAVLFAGILSPLTFAHQWLWLSLNI